jgi:cell division protein FtsN
VAAAEPAPAVARPTQAPPVLAPAVSAAPAPQPAPAQQAAPAPQQTASVGTGDFAVQLAAPPTEQEARLLAARLTQRFGDALAGQEPDIIRAEVNGKTLYRVRVTGLDRESANTMCNRIKSAQGSCFVAKN